MFAGPSSTDDADISTMLVPKLRLSRFVELSVLILILTANVPTQKVVMDCSFIPLSLRTVALGILDEVSQNKMYQRDSGHWERNEYSKGHDSSRVVFMSMLHVGLRPRSTRKINPDAAKTLLEFVYYNGVEEDRENEQVVRKMDVGSPSECLHVSTLWCLLLGSGRYASYTKLLSKLTGQVSSSPFPIFLWLNCAEM